jgi:hypothetical protein
MIEDTEHVSVADVPVEDTGGECATRKNDISCESTISSEAPKEDPMPVRSISNDIKKKFHKYPKFIVVAIFYFQNVQCPYLMKYVIDLSTLMIYT